MSEQSEVEDEGERIVDVLLLRRRQPAHDPFEALDIDRANLLDEHPRALITELDLRTKGGRGRTP